MAVHPHLITYDKGEWHRWEVWQDPDENGNHVYRDLFPLNNDIGWGPWLEMEWSGDKAKRVIGLLNIVYEEPHAYPFNKEYVIFPWPQPNSNTFVSWVLYNAGIKMDFPLRALGSYR